MPEIINLVNANELELVEEPETGSRLLLFDGSTNDGYSINYESLASAILSKVYRSGDMPFDGLKFYVVDSES